MEQENENREKLLQSAKKEFLEKGFAKASLRKISAEADMTTGVVYFFLRIRTVCSAQSLRNRCKVLLPRSVRIFQPICKREYLLHWFSHVQINAFVHLITHEPDEQKARKAVKPVLDLLVEGWMAHILEDA